MMQLANSALAQCATPQILSAARHPVNLHRTVPSAVPLSILSAISQRHVPAIRPIVPKIVTKMMARPAVRVETDCRALVEGARVWTGSASSLVHL